MKVENDQRMRQERQRVGTGHFQDNNVVNEDRGEFRIRQGVPGRWDLFLPYPTPSF